MLRVVVKYEGHVVSAIAAWHWEMPRSDFNEVIKRTLVWNRAAPLAELDFVCSKIVLDLLPGHSRFEDLTIRRHSRPSASGDAAAEKAETDTH